MTTDLSLNGRVLQILSVGPCSINFSDGNKSSRILVDIALVDFDRDVSCGEIVRWAEENNFRLVWPAYLLALTQSSICSRSTVLEVEIVAVQPRKSDHALCLRFGPKGCGLFSIPRDDQVLSKEHLFAFVIGLSTDP